ncbi:MAG: hypothetical protein E7122_07225 [Bacteroidales bacterium]|nr:hypothetical protein [Bacteroidales bacterium]
MALVAVMLGFAMSACSDDDDDYLKELEKEYSRLIVGKWFNFTPTESVFMNFNTDNAVSVVGYDKTLGWMENYGTYRIEGDMIIRNYHVDGAPLEVSTKIEVSTNKLILKAGSDSYAPELGDRVHYRVQEQFDITGKYSYLNSAVRVDAKAGKTEIKLPEGITFGGKNTISVEALHGDRIVEQMKSFFADAMFTPNAKLRHTVDGTVMYKDYALDGNNLSFELNKGHELNATSFPDEDGDRLFIIIPKQEAWVGGLADVIRKENPANVITDEVVAALEKEFMDTFETFTVVLSLSKTGEYNAAEDVDPYKDYPQLIVGQWFDFTPQSSMYLVFESDNSYSQVGYGVSNGWRERRGTYRMEGNKLTREYVEDGESVTKTEVIEVTADKFIQMRNDATGDRVNYRVKESFDIAGKYTYLNSAVRVDAEAGKTALQLPEGILFDGQNYIPVEALHGDRIVEQMKKFFADATFAADGKLNHTIDGEAKVKNYTLDGNNLVFNLYEGSEVYKVNATTFPDEDGDRLFIIIPKQAAWMGGFVELIEKENTGLKMTEAQIKELETEFLTTFDTFTVILSLSKK